MLSLTIYMKANLSHVEHLGNMKSNKNKTDLLQGTLDMLILKALSRSGPIHGYGISVQIRKWSEDVLRVEQGSLYPALYRLEEQGWIDSEWGISENKRRAKYYRLTLSGKKQLEEESANWERLSVAVNLIMQAG